MVDEVEDVGPDAGQLLYLVIEPWRNLAVVRIVKRQRLFEAAGSRTDTAEVEAEGRRIMTAPEHEDTATLRGAVTNLGLKSHENVD